MPDEKARLLHRRDGFLAELSSPDSPVRQSAAVPRRSRPGLRRDVADVSEHVPAHVRHAPRQRLAAPFRILATCEFARRRAGCPVPTAAEKQVTQGAYVGAGVT